MTAPLNSHRETADAYLGVVFQHGHFRVAVCRDGIQWLFQRKRTGSAGVGATWDTLGYCTTRKALTRLHRAHLGHVPRELDRFPVHIRDKSQ